MIELPFTHKNGAFGAISVMGQSCVALISEVEIQILDRCLYRPRTVILHSKELRAAREKVKLCKLIVKWRRDSFLMAETAASLVFILG